MFNAQQREVLNGLSKQLYGTESKWAKELNKGSFNMPDGEEKVTEEVEQVQLPGKKGKRGTILSRAKYIMRLTRGKKGLALSEAMEKLNLPETSERTIPNTRKPTF